MKDIFIVNRHGVVHGIPADHLDMVIARGGRKASDEEAIEAGLLKPAPKVTKAPAKRASKAKAKD